jgi:hypothetical protein
MVLTVVEKRGTHILYFFNTRQPYVEAENMAEVGFPWEPKVIDPGEKL